MLDTSVAVHVRDGDQGVMARVDAIVSRILLPIVTRVELEGGVYRVKGREAIRRERLDLMYQTFECVDFDERCAAAYAAIVAASGYSRRKLLDRMIAAQALVHSATLATKNPGDFSDVPGLTVEAW